MRDRLPVKKDSWLLMEGIYDESKRLEKTIKSEHKVVLYTGNLSKRYGILELLNAFRQIEDDNYRLWICGNGDGKEDVISMAMMDKRIEYKGVLSHDEVLLLQKQATILVNPRSSAGEYTKYSFPSKTMEYLASGTPTIMCHLPAIPKEYDDYLFYFTDESAEGIKDKIVEVCSKSNDELMSFGKKAADFILNNKTPKIQMGRVLSFIFQEQN
jgi:glycosyltransferase involved in cell wall biosynthesis